MSNRPDQARRKGAGPGIEERQLQVSSGLRVGTASFPLFWQPDLCTSARPFGGTYSAADIGLSISDSVPSAAYTQPIVNSATWKHVKVSHQSLPFPCTPCVRLRETAGDATFATASTGGVVFKVRITGLDQFGNPQVYEQPREFTTIANNVVLALSPGADNRALDTILHVPMIFSRIFTVEYQASGVHANQDFLDVGVAWCLDGYAAALHTLANPSGASSLTHEGTKAPSVKFPWAINQAIGIPLHQEGIHQTPSAVDNKPFPKRLFAPEILTCSLVNISSPESVLGGGEIVALDPQLDNTIGASVDVADSTVINGIRVLDPLKGGYRHAISDVQGARAVVGGPPTIHLPPGRLHLGVLASQLSMNPCNIRAIAGTSAHVQGALQFVATGNFIYRGEGSFIKDGWAPGMVLTVAGTSSNNAYSAAVVKVERHRLTMASAPTNETSTAAVLTGTAPNSRSGYRNFGYAANKNDQLAGWSTSIGQTYLACVTYRTVVGSSRQGTRAPGYPR